jgi:hypothetical protein
MGMTICGEGACGKREKAKGRAESVFSLGAPMPRDAVSIAGERIGSERDTEGPACRRDGPCRAWRCQPRSPLFIIDRRSLGDSLFSIGLLWASAFR